MDKAISLFSGCGGDTLGLEQAGFKVVAFSELKPTIAKSHLANFPESTYILDTRGKTGDITKIEDGQFSKYKGLSIDLVFAGFPCQGFSHAGKKSATDPRNQMFRQFIRVTKEVRPLFVIGENVVGLEKFKSGPNVGDPLMIDCIKGAFSEIGYDLVYKVHEATAFGVPQKRKRLLIVGWDTTRLPEFKAKEASLWASIARLGAQKQMVLPSSFVSNTMEGAYLIPTASIPEGFNAYALAVAEDAEPLNVPHPYVVLKTNQNLLSCTKRDSPVHSEIVNLDAPMKTIICTYGHQPRLLVGLKKPSGACYARCLTPDELKQVQGFPASYRLEGSTSEKIIQIGNAVPPPMIECVAKALKLLV